MDKLMTGSPSELYLNGYLQSHSEELEREIMATLGAGGVKWKNPTVAADIEIAVKWSGFDFMRPGKIRSAWDNLWPHDVDQPEWDALGRVQMGNSGCWEWLYVQANAHIEELKGDCPAVREDSARRINTLLEKAKGAVGAPETADWMHGYYPHAVRLGVRKFLQGNSICGRTAFIYFTGRDGTGAGKPPSKSQWQNAIDRMEQHLGLSGKSVLERRIYRLFLPVHGQPSN